MCQKDKFGVKKVVYMTILFLVFLHHWEEGFGIGNLESRSFDIKPQKISFFMILDWEILRRAWATQNPHHLLQVNPLAPDW
jgi:hypothetical protein